MQKSTSLVLLALSLITLLLSSSCAEAKPKVVQPANGFDDEGFGEDFNLTSLSFLPDGNLSYIDLHNAHPRTIILAARADPFGIGNSIKNWFLNLIEKGKKAVSCRACTGAEVAVATLYKYSPKLLYEILHGVCKVQKKFDETTCRGLVDTQGPVLFKVISKFDRNYDGKLLCAALLDVCPYPETTAGKMQFPKPKPVDATAPKNSGKTLNVLHLSDWHVDSHYKPGSDAVCDRPTCCRSDSGSNPPKRPASIWGDYSCDTPQLLADNMIDHIVKKDNIDLGFLTGDLVAHDIWIADKEAAEKNIKRTWDGLHRKLNKAVKTFFPVVGNHDFVPINLSPPKHYPEGKDDPQYPFFAEQWEKFLDSDTAKQVVKNTGSYSYTPEAYPKLKVISLNTNWCYTLNFYVLDHARDHPDPNLMLAWLVSELQDAEDNGQRVWILGHHPSGQSDCMHNYSHLFYQIVQRYSPHVIAGIFFGHTHRDEFEVFYSSDDDRDAKHAIAVGYIAPSVTTYTNKNPTYRVYKVDAETFTVVDSLTYYADISQASKWEKNDEEPEWKLEYSARKDYAFDSPHAPLTPAWWHTLTVQFEKNNELFDKFFLYRTGSAGREGKCDSTCKKELICQMRAGKSELGCFTSPFSKRGIEGQESAETPLWKQNLCNGLHL
ncbi:uncharacterized protein VTP21DRAFT_6913 [Calcarisporiella thermophila]|uniref:uncharacterized protein n=1 Tax=Calcarisporiella thermophila TaxID=911321 RepID=UPI0037436090